MIRCRCAVYTASRCLLILPCISGYLRGNQIHDHCQPSSRGAGSLSAVGTMSYKRSEEASSSRNSRYASGSLASIYQDAFPPPATKALGTRTSPTIFFFHSPQSMALNPKYS
ncbi:hypothetical protein R3P38DRAFT_2936735, partial [Favolaschia claudopus]